MKTARKNPLRFADLPDDYAALCRFHLPRPIHDNEDYQITLQIASAFAGFEEAMSADQEDYFDLLTSILHGWESTMLKKTPQVPPLDRLRHLLDEHGMKAADLSRLLGASRQLGPMILRGERAITVDHARALGAHFGLPAGAFIE